MYWEDYIKKEEKYLMIYGVMETSPSTQRKT